MKKRDYKRYRKYGKTHYPAKKYRAALNKYNRKKKTYGNEMVRCRSLRVKIKVLKARSIGPTTGPRRENSKG